MKRPQSQETPRIGYENIESRVKRLLGQSTDHSSIGNGLTSALQINVNNNFLPRYSESNRSNLKKQSNGMFGIDISNNIGKVSRNTGIKKCNQRHIQSTAELNSKKNNFYDDHEGNREHWSNPAKERKIEQRLFNYPSNHRYTTEEEGIFCGKYANSRTNFLNCAQESTVANQEEIGTQSTKELQPGNIYSLAELNKLLYN